MLSFSINLCTSKRTTLYKIRKTPYIIFAEREWRHLKAEYESYIMALEAERDTRQRRGSKQQVNKLSLYLMKVMKARVFNVIWNKKDTEVQVMQNKHSSREKGITMEF